MSDKLAPFDKKATEIKFHEWLAILILIGIIAGLTIITSNSQLNSHGQKIDKAPAHARKNGVEIIVKGAVRYTGTYRLPPGMLMSDILNFADPLPNADLRRYKLETPLNRSRMINVPLRTMIKVHVKGAVKGPQVIEVPKGTRLEELIEKVIFAENANLNVLKKKRKLKADEIIDVPFSDTP